MALITLTTWRRLTDAEFGRAQASLWRKARRDLGRVEYAAFLHLTAGRPGVRRREHLHVLVKVDAERADDLRLLACREWKRSTGASQVDVLTLRREDVAAAVIYAASGGVSGMQASHGYFSRPITELREQVRRERREMAIARRVRVALERCPASALKESFIASLVQSELGRQWKLRKAGLRRTAN